MWDILSVTLPFFALVGCGWLAARWRVLPESAIPGLNAFVLYFALPCMLFRFGQRTPVLELLNPSALGVYLICALVIVAFALAVTWNHDTRLKDAAFGALVTAFPNTGFMGIPLLVTLLGPAAIGPLVCTLLVDLFITSSVCIALAQLGRSADGVSTGSARGETAAALRRALRGALSNPLPWSIAAGAAFSVAGWRLEGPPDVIVRMLADAASPVALFTIGAVLWRAGAHAQTRTPLGHYLPSAMMKLVLHPLLVLLTGAVARQLGAPLEPTAIAVLTLAAALPSASNVSLLAERYGADNGRVARIIMSSTVLAFFSFPALVWVLGLRA
jgi:predicted permease